MNKYFVYIFFFWLLPSTVVSQYDVTDKVFYRLELCEWDNDSDVLLIKKNKPIVCDIYVVSFDSNSCTKRHIFFSYDSRKKKWISQINTYMGSYQYVNDSTLLYQDSCLYHEKGVRLELVKILYNPDPMGTLEEVFTLKDSSTIMKGQMLLNTLSESNWSMTERRALKRELKRHGLPFR
jgi:hypothetical protein